MRRAFPATRALAVVAAAGLVLTGCSLKKHSSSPAPAPAVSATPSATPHQSNGFLKLGTLLPETGSLVILGPQQIAAVKLAVQDINAAGGVLGKPAQLEESDSGDSSTDIATQSVNRLIGDNVDAIVGAASSAVTLNVIDKVTGSGVLMISGSATSTKLQDYQDHGLFFRTAPSDVYQGRVVADTALDDGAQTMGILALQDAYGTSLATQAGSVFTDGGGKVVVQKIYDPKASEFSAEVAALKAANPDAMVLIGFDESSKIIQEMVKQGLLPLSKSHKHMYMVDGNMTNTYTLPPGTLEGVKGTIPGSRPTADFEARLRTINSNLTDYNYAGEAYDATVLVALAAEEAKSDNGVDMAAHMQDITNGSANCSNFADCDKLIKAGTSIHYQGISGPIDFDSNGNPSVASMGVYEYGVDNKYKPLKFVSGPIAGGPTTGAGSTSPSTSSPSTSSPSPSTSPTGSPTPSSSTSPGSGFGLSATVKP
jgi:branched-chain amino acid transport system substrate-binding protein